MKKKLKLFLKIFISLGLIALLIYFQDLNKIIESLSTFKIGYLIISFIGLLIGTSISCLRWQVILKSSNVEVDYIYLLKLYIKGYFYNNFLPTQMGGDVYKSIALGKKINDNGVALFSVFMERFGGLLMIFVLSAVGIGSIYGKLGLLLSILGVFIGLVLYFPILNLANKILGKKIKLISKFKEASQLFVKDKNSGIKVILYSMLVQVFSILSIWAIFMGLDINLPLSQLIVNVPLSGLVLLVPSFNGYGTQETVYALLFASAGVVAATSIAASVIVHIIRLIMSLLGGLLILIDKE